MEAPLMRASDGKLTYCPQDVHFSRASDHIDTRMSSRFSVESHRRQIVGVMEIRHFMTNCASLVVLRSLGKLKANVEQINLIFDNSMTRPLYAASYLQTHRKRAGLSRREVARLLGLLSENQVGRHERGAFLPTFLVAVSYEIVFQVRIAELFPGAYEAVRREIEERLTAFESELQQSTVTGRKAARVARRLEWLWERKHPEASLFP
jgi:transcriptional regulator with XRE-family HTH domain